MPVVNPLARELVFKVVYYGPGLGGKTTSLQYIHATAKPEHRGKMVSLATPVDRTLYFDFLPIRVPNVRGMSVKLQLFTVPGQVHYNATRKLVLTGADGVVLVYDSQSARSDANLETLDNLRDNLAAHGRQISEMPHVVQYNKRDLFDVLPMEALRRAEDSDAWGEELAERAARSVQRNPSGLLFLSDMPDADVGEAAALAVARDLQRLPRHESVPPAPESHFDTEPPVPPMSEPPPVPRLSSAPPPPPEITPSTAPPGLSFELLWPVPERGMVRELESTLAQGDYERSITLAEQLVSRALASAAALLGGNLDAPRDPSTVALLLGLDGRRYLEFRALVRDVRGGGRGVNEAEALAAYATAIEVLLARGRIQ